MKMKTIALIFGVLLFNTILVAQKSDIDRREDFSFGGKVGINSSNIYASHGQDFVSNSKIGVMIGVYGAIPISKYIGFQPEISISQKGFVGSGTLLGNAYTVKRTATFIDIPVLVQIKPIEFLTFLIGPQYSYLLNEKNKFEFGSNSAAQQAEFDKEIARRNIIGFVTGADVNISNILITGRFGFDLQDNIGDKNLITPRYKNFWIQIGLGYRL